MDTHIFWIMFPDVSTIYCIIFLYTPSLSHSKIIFVKMGFCLGSFWVREWKK